MTEEDFFHKELDRFMRKKIEAKLKESPYYFIERLSAIDVLAHLHSLPLNRREKIECTAKSDGNRIAVHELMDAMKRHFKFAFQFLESLEASGHEDIAEDLLRGLEIDDLPFGNNTNFIRKLAKHSSSTVASRSSPISSGDIQNDLEQEQTKTLRRYERRRSPPPPYQHPSPPAAAFSSHYDLPMNIVNSMTTADNNPSGESSLFNVNGSQSMFDAAAGSYSVPTPSRSVREATSRVCAEGNLGSKPEDDVNILVRDARPPEREGCDTISNSLNGTNRSRDVSPGSSSEFQATRYDAMIPSPARSANHDIPPGTLDVNNPVLVDGLQTVPKEVAAPQHSVSVRDPSVSEPFQAASWQKPSTTSLDNGATMSTQGAVEEFAMKDVESSTKPVNTKSIMETNYTSVSVKAVETSDAKGLEENHHHRVGDCEKPNCHPSAPAEQTSSEFGTFVACLAAVSIFVFVLKRFKLLDIE